MHCHTSTIPSQPNAHNNTTRAFSTRSSWKSLPRYAGALVLLALLTLPGNHAQAVQIEEVKRIPQQIDYDAFWSPSGLSLVFISNRNGPLNIYRMGWDGSAIERLTNHAAGDDTPSVSPDGSRIAFVTFRDGNPEIYVMDADGQNQVRLTDNPGNDIHPFWSPDGQSIIFNSSRDDPNTEDDEEIYEIYVMDADGNNQRRITRDGGINTYACYSPDGTQIAFRKIVEGNSEVYVMDADGANQVNISNHAAFDGWPAWSPGGEKIAFASDRKGNQNIYVMNKDGTDVVKIFGVLGRHTAPMWSPDGTKIVFTRSLNGEARIMRLSLDRE